MAMSSAPHQNELNINQVTTPKWKGQAASVGERNYATKSYNAGKSMKSFKSMKSMKSVLSFDSSCSVKTHKS